MTNFEKSTAVLAAQSILEKPITFGKNGIKLNGKIFMPEKASGQDRVPGAVLCHGYGSDQSAFENSARELAAQGVGTLIFDFRGHGSSEGVLDGRVVEDVMDAWEYLHNQPEIDHKHMGLIGHSMGAFSAILAAGKLKKARVLVTLSCPGEIKNSIAENPHHFLHPFMELGIIIIFKITKRLANLKVRVNWKKFIRFWPRMKPSQSLAGLDDCSKLFVFCLSDIAAPYNKFLYSYAMASEPKQIMITPGNHNSPMESSSVRTQWQKWVVGALNGTHPNY